MYKFTSKAVGDVLMLREDGDHVLRLLGREPSARGIFELADLPDAVAALRLAITVAEVGTKSHDTHHTVSLRQRVWPLVQMLERCNAAREPILWGA